MTHEALVVNEYDTVIDAYVMVRNILRNNELIRHGETPTDADGQPLAVEFRTDENIQISVGQAFGYSPRIEGAVKAAYDNHYKEMLKSKGAE